MSTVIQIVPGITYFNDTVFGVPNAILRSALFGIIKNGRRKTFDTETEISSVKGVEIHYKGEQLDQLVDLTVWMQLVSMSLDEGDDELLYFKPIKFVSAYELLRKLGKSTGGSDVQWLKATLTRLQNGFVRITETTSSKNKKKAFTGNFIPSILWVGDTPQLIKINSELANMFTDGFTRLSIEERNKLGKDALALWFHAFYSTHKDTTDDNPCNYSVETIRELSGSESDIYEFRRSLKKVFLKMQEKIGWRCKVNEKGAVVVRKKSNLIVEAEAQLQLGASESASA